MENILQHLQSELAHEYQTTRKFFERFPEGQNDYAPHQKSMKLMPLAAHIAEVFAWPQLILHTEGIDFAKGDYKPTVLHNREDLLQFLDKSYETGKAALEKAESLEGRWGLSHGSHKLADWTKYEAIRHALNQVTHHRAQLGVYYRLSDVPLPGSYGPSADEQNF